MKISPKLIKISEDEVCEFLCDSRIVGIRWDLIPSSIVLDLEIPALGEDDDQFRRCWAIFSGLSKLSLPIVNACLPTGLVVISEMNIALLANDNETEILRASFVVIFTDGSNDYPKNMKDIEVVIESKKIFGVTSINFTSLIEGNTGLNWEQRRNLASEEEMLKFINSEQQ